MRRNAKKIGSFSIRIDELIILKWSIAVSSNTNVHCWMSIEEYIRKVILCKVCSRMLKGREMIICNHCAPEYRKRKEREKSFKFQEREKEKIRMFRSLSPMTQTRIMLEHTQAIMEDIEHEL